MTIPAASDPGDVVHDVDDVDDVDGAGAAGGDMHREVESVFAVDDAFVVPELAGVGPVAGVRVRGVQELDATYYDTPALRLIRAGVTLRRRSGGSDEGWHLKLPDGEGRLEVRRPLDSAIPPAALLALVQAWLRGRPVAPVARLHTGRTVHDLRDEAGGLLAELADDRVWAEVLGPDGAPANRSSWREIEVELADPDAPAVLGPTSARLQEAGANSAEVTSKLARALGERLRPDPADPAHHVKQPGRRGRTARKKRRRAEPVMAYLREQVEELVRRDPQVRLDQPDAVHKARVACRRLRTTLAAFRSLFVGAEGERLRAEVRWIAGVMGVARDAEVMRDKLLAEVDRHDPALMVGPIRHRIDTELRRRYREAHADVVRALDSHRYGQLLDDLEGFAADPPLADLGGDDLAEGVRRSHRRVRRLVGEAREAGEGERHDLLLHEVRKAAKRARYAGEVVVPEVGRAAERYAEAAKVVQEVLGDHHDSVVEQDELQHLAGRAQRAGESGFGYGVMHADLRHRRALDEEEYLRAWHELRQAARRWPG